MKEVKVVSNMKGESMEEYKLNILISNVEDSEDGVKFIDYDTVLRRVYEIANNFKLKFKVVVTEDSDSVVKPDDLGIWVEFVGRLKNLKNLVDWYSLYSTEQYEEYINQIEKV